MKLLDLHTSKSSYICTVFQEYRHTNTYTYTYTYKISQIMYRNINSSNDYYLKIKYFTDNVSTSTTLLLDVLVQLLHDAKIFFYFGSYTCVLISIPDYLLVGQFQLIYSFILLETCRQERIFSRANLLNDLDISNLGFCYQFEL